MKALLHISLCLFTLSYPSVSTAQRIDREQEMLQVKYLGRNWAKQPNGKAKFFIPGPAVLQGADPKFQNIAEVAYIDDNRRVWIAPLGTITDGASIPQACLSFVGDRYDKRWSTAALVHDAYCGEANEAHPYYHSASWRDVHRMFYSACLAGGTSVMKAKIMYAAVWMFGPKWVYPTYTQSATESQNNKLAEKSFNEYRSLSIEKISSELKTQQLNQIIGYINVNDPSLEKLDGILEAASYSLQLQRGVLQLPGE
jgi:hypothetical protein